MPFENGSEFVSEMPLGIEKFIHIFTCYDYTIFNIALNFSLDNFGLVLVNILKKGPFLVNKFFDGRYCDTNSFTGFNHN